MDDKKLHDNHSHSYGIYILVWLALVALTGLTAAVAGINFGKLSIVVAILIAVVKSYLVLTEFMHLKSEQRTFKVFIFVALFFILVSLTLLFSDYSYYGR
ncbi:MAG: cytochrome C oxidase subunit IV family protein [Ignavibacteriaceae bacterium]